MLDLLQSGVAYCTVKQFFCVTKEVGFLLEIRAVITKRVNFFYKMGKVLQRVRHKTVMFLKLTLY